MEVRLLPEIRDAARRARATILRARADAYRALLGAPGAPRTRAQKIVLADLKRFCRADQPCFDPDPRVHALLEGRREVWLRIASALALTDDEIAELTEVMDDE